MGTSISLSPALLHLFFQLPSATVLWFQLELREPARLFSSSPQHPKTKQFPRLLILKNFLKLDCLLRMCLGILLLRIFVLCLRNMVRSWMWRYATLVCFSVRTFSLSNFCLTVFWFIVNWWSVSFCQLSMYNKIRNRGLAFVTMGSPEEALAALNNLESYVSRMMFFLIRMIFNFFLLCPISSLRIKTMFTLHYERTLSIEINRVWL